MDKRLILLILVILGVGGLLSYKFYFSKQKGGLAGLKIVSTPTASIFLGEKNLGRTPYEDKISSGEYILKLIPEGSSTQAASWQGKVTLFPSVLTFIDRELGTSDLTSAGEILTLEKISDKDAQVAVISTPDGALVTLDGQEKGTAPLILRGLTIGDHDLTLSSPGFITRTIKVRTTAGYKLNANFQLALSGEPTPTPTASSSGGLSKSGKPFVTIKDTPTGWLRVREEASLTSSEAAKVKPGEEYTLLDTNDGWYKIQYSEGKEGWISNKYADKSE
ncbi:MAG: Amylopullulanase, GH57 family [Candidatus Gottesmanbacteria bacterium GW2011_GWA2_41_12]|uniref:Amylopullulanase, GH57 family n=2 Tax=Candidatus Gottesmaniibacteriota TaxID=1752720 RepID=A0A0G0UM70_9BACT|nr:MAG: Amylopullulanase, GH57 family [Candidatus Gottesmanbacteria bacterium GW2011_GWC2_39_8]KKR88611.1 MAG: Amylopullulanase, GH57 family [Candidatus Gottesmanbacteria bacterium GW2011_GWA2_41_12]